MRIIYYYKLAADERYFLTLFVVSNLFNIKKRVYRPSGIRLPKELSQHKYTRCSMLPKRKRKASHNLQLCLFDNKCLGGRKKTKTMYAYINFERKIVICILFTK